MTTRETPLGDANWKKKGSGLGFQDTFQRRERADFRKITVTLPPALYERLVRESARRKIAAEPNRLLSGLVREAVFEYLMRIGK